MFERLGSWTYRFRFAIAAAWIIAAGWSVLFAPSLAAEGTTDQSAFLPADSPSVRAAATLERAFPGSTSASTATLAFTRSDGLTDADRRYLAEVAEWITGPDAPSIVRDSVTGVSTATSRPELASMLRSDDGALELMTVGLDVSSAGSEAATVVAAIRAHLAQTVPIDRPGLVANVTGTAAISSDYLDAILAGTESTTVVTIVLVIVILLLIYRAPLAALVPLATIGAAFLLSRGVLGVLAAAGWKVSSLLDTFIVVLVFGVGTDYAIFLISRFREEVARADWHRASRATVRRIGAVITASAATVMVGLGSMAFADFGMIQTTGPALAVAIGVTLVAGLTLSPALLAIFGHYLFWPLHTRVRPEGDTGGFFARLAAAVSRHPGLVTVVLLAVLAVPAAAMGQMKTNFDVLSELPADSDARAGFDQVATHMGRGTVVQSSGVIDVGASADVLAPAALARLRDVSQALVATDGVSSVTSLVSPDGDGSVPDGLRPSAQLTSMAEGLTSDTAADDATAASREALLDDEVSRGLTAASEYLALLGAAYPDVAASTAFEAVTERLATATDQIEQVRRGTVVATQLRTLQDAMTSSSAAANARDDTSVSLVGDYLDELGAAFPEVAELDAFGDAQAAAGSLEVEVSVGAALDLSTALGSLATHFEDTVPAATMAPDSLAGTAEAKRLRANVQATFDALPADLGALAALFAARPDDVFVPIGLSGEAATAVDEAVAAFVSEDGTATRFYLTTTDDPYSQTAFASIRRAQDTLTGAARGFGPEAVAFLGGPSAELADVQTVLGADFQRVAVITVLGILIVLIVLLRAIVAPLYLVATVLLSCATALGLSTWFFQNVLGQAGVSFYLPLMVFVLLVALGSDYNIFLMSRVREESERYPIRDAIRIASGRTGAVITSAGLILAGTFGSMATAELVVLFQVGVAVALGVLIDTFLVRSILVPAITTLVGDWAWWPSGAHGIARLGRPVVISVEPGVGPGGPSRRRSAVAVAMMACIPMAFAGLLTWSLADPAANLDRVTAAIVNEDTGTTTGDDGTATELDLGEELAAELVADTSTDTFTWRVAGRAEAAEGLASGRFGAVLTIPSDFSQTIAGIRASSPQTAAKATLRLTTNDATSYLLGTVARSLGTAIAASTSDGVTAAYVDDVLLAVDDAQGAVAAAAADADQLTDGTTDLADDAAGVTTVAGGLVIGLEQLAEGTSSASDGVARLADGVDRLADGTHRLASGATQLGAGAGTAADGAAGLAAGADSLADGLVELSAATADLPAQAEALDRGATQVAAGASGVADGNAKLAGSLADMTAGASGVADGIAAVDASAAALAAGAADLEDASGALAAGAGDLAGSANAVAASVDAYTDAVATIAADCAALGGSDPLCAQLADIAAGSGAIDGGTAGIAAAADDVAAGTAGVAAGAGKLASGAAKLADGTGPLAVGTATLRDGIDAAATGARTLAAGSADLAAGADALASGTATLAGSAPALSSAVSKAATGATGLAGGAHQVASGVDKVAAGVDSLASGAKATADGASTLASGTSRAASGASQLADAMDDAIDGARLVASGTGSLADDGSAVAAEAETLATGLDDAAAAIPNYSEDDRAALSDIVADPVTVDETRLNAVPSTGSGLAPYFMAVALWLGALGIFLVLPALPRRLERARWWSDTATGSLVVAGAAVAGALLMIAVLSLGVGVEIARLPELIVFTVLVTLAVVVVTQALVALFGTRGWFAALFFVIVQLTSAGAWYPVETAPAVFGVLHPILPMSYAVDGFRTLVAGGGQSLVVATAVQLLWLVSAALVIFAVAHHRIRGTRPPDVLATPGLP